MQVQPTPVRLLCLPVVACDRCGDAVVLSRGSIVCGKCRRRDSARKGRLHQIQDEKGARA